MTDPADELFDSSNNGESIEEKESILFEELELAIKWDRPSILVGVYESEFLREKIAKDLQEKLGRLGQVVENFHIDEKQFDVPMILVQYPDHERTVYFITGLKWGGGKGGFNAYRALNMRREFFVDNQMRVVLWLTKNEASNLPRHSPDFWAFRHRVIEFLGAPEQDTPKAKDGLLTWDGSKAIDLLPDIEEKISLREKLLEQLPEGIESQGPRMDLLYILASFYWAKGDYARAVDRLEKGTELADRTRDAFSGSQFRVGIGVVLHSQGDYQSAAKAYEKALELNSFNQHAWNNLSLAYSSLGDNSKAIHLCRKSLELKPKNALAYTIMGDTYKSMGQFEEARDSYHAACKIDPKAAINWINLGDIFLLQNRNKEALRAYLRASRLDPNDISVYKKLGDVYTKTNRYSDAKKVYKKALAISPENKEIQGLLSAIQ